MAMKVKVIRKCINQDTHRMLEPGDIVDDLSDFERGRHLAEGNVVPLCENEIERAVKTPPEKRRRRRKKQNGTD